MVLRGHRRLAVCALLILWNLLLPQVYAAASATSFCRCACSTNSTIIALNPPSNPQSPNSSGSSSSRTLSSRSKSLRSSVHNSIFPRSNLFARDATSHKLSCSDCNRSFCRSHLASSSLCSTAKEEEIFATCFQRDSLKDQIIVWVFICGVLGLMSWAGLREFILPLLGDTVPRLKLASTSSSRAGGGLLPTRRSGARDEDGYVRVGDHSRQPSGMTEDDRIEERAQESGG